MNITNSLLQVSKGALLGSVIIGIVFIFVATCIDVPYAWVDASGYCLRAEDGRGLDIPCEVALNDPSHVELRHRVLP